MNKLFWVVLALVLASCGTAHHYAPMQPMTDGPVEGTFSLNYSLSGFHAPVLQFGLYFKVTDRDMVGLSLQNFVLPNTLSYVRLWDTESLSGNYQVHFNGLISSNHSPTYEIRTAIFDKKNNPNHAFDIGLGIYSTPLIYRFANRKTPFSVTPIAGYQFRSEYLVLQGQYIYGYHKNKINENLRYNIRGFDYELNQWIDEGPELTYSYEDVASFYKTENDQGIEQWVIKTADGDSLVMAEREPYPDCHSCGRMISNLSTTIPNSDFQVFWITTENGGEFAILKVHEAYQQYMSGNSFDLRTGLDYLEQALSTTRPFVDNFSFSIGVRLRD